MATLTNDQVLQIAVQALQLRGLTYDEGEGLIARFAERGSARGGTHSFWVVSYVSRSGLLEPRDYFMHIHDGTGNVMHILGPHGKLREPVK